MDNKKLALIILVVVVVGAYASYYAYASMVLIPEDKKVFKDELASLGNVSSSDADIAQMEQAASQIESIDLTVIPAAERKTLADQMRSDPFFTTWNASIAELKQNITRNQEIASRYDLLLKGNVANNIRSIYSQDLVAKVEALGPIFEKIPNDLEKGDGAAYARDVRELAKSMKELQQQLIISKAKLETVVNELGG